MPAVAGAAAGSGVGESAGARPTEQAARARHNSRHSMTPDVAPNTADARGESSLAVEHAFFGLGWSCNNTLPHRFSARHQASQSQRDYTVGGMFCQELTPRTSGSVACFSARIARSVTHLLGWPFCSTSRHNLPLYVYAILQRPARSCLPSSQVSAFASRGSPPRPSATSASRFCSTSVTYPSG